MFIIVTAHMPLIIERFHWIRAMTSKGLPGVFCLPPETGPNVKCLRASQDHDLALPDVCEYIFQILFTPYYY